MMIVSSSTCSITLTPHPASVVEALLHGILTLGLVYIYPLFFFFFGILVFYSFLCGFVVSNLCNVKPQAMTLLSPYRPSPLIDFSFMITYPYIILSTHVIASLTYPHTHSRRTNGCHVQSIKSGVPYCFPHAAVPRSRHHVSFTTSPKESYVVMYLCSYP